MLKNIETTLGNYRSYRSDKPSLSFSNLTCLLKRHGRKGEYRKEHFLRVLKSKDRSIISIAKVFLELQNDS